MWRGTENLGMDEEPHRLDIANGPGLDGSSAHSSMFDRPNAIGQYFGSWLTWCDVGHMGVGHFQRRSTSTFHVGPGGRRIGTRECDPSRELSVNP
jgi:hypothetical protein